MNGIKLGKEQPKVRGLEGDRVGKHEVVWGEKQRDVVPAKNKVGLW